MNSQRRGNNFHRIKRQAARTQSKRFDFSAELITNSVTKSPLVSDRTIELEHIETTLVVERSDYECPKPISRVDSKMTLDMKSNRTIQILEGARVGKYGILAAIA